MKGFIVNDHHISCDVHLVACTSAFDFSSRQGSINDHDNYQPHDKG